MLTLLTLIMFMSPLIILSFADILMLAYKAIKLCINIIYYYYILSQYTIVMQYTEDLTEIGYIDLALHAWTD